MITMHELAPVLLGERNERESRGNDWRYGNHGSLSVNIEKDTFFDHESNLGGGVLDLVCHRRGMDRQQANRWLKQNFPGTQNDSAPEAVYEYCDETGRQLYQVLRYTPKTFRQRTPDGKWTIKGVRRVLYRLPKLQGKSAVYIVEGEKDVHTAEKMGLPATCNSGGAGKWSDDYTKQLVDAGIRRAVILPDNDDAGRDHAVMVAQSLFAAGIEAKILELPGLPPKGDLSDWITAGGNREKLISLVKTAAIFQPDKPLSPIAVRQLSAVTATPIRWLWPGRIARGKITMIAGDPGLGKSQISASLAAIVTTNGLWPVDRAKCDGGKVIFLNAEDDAADTLKPRLLAAGADVTKCFVLDAVRELNGERPFNLGVDLPRLDAFLTEMPGAALVVIDPISAYLGSTDSHKNADVRALLSPLGMLAAKHQIAIVCVSHLNKSSSGNALSRVTGSLAFVAAARAAFVVCKDPDDDSRRLFLPAKNNIGPDGSGLAYHIVNRMVEDGIETSAIKWHSERVSLTADEALAPQHTGRPPDERDEAKDFLLRVLADGPVLQSELQAQAKAEVIAWRTIERAKSDAGIKAVRIGKKWGWQLPTQDRQLKTASARSHNYGGLEDDDEPFAVSGPKHIQEPQDRQDRQYFETDNVGGLGEWEGDL